MDQHYDYIIAGAGASGLSLAWKLMQSPLADKKVLIIDENPQATHDKTWCFWEAGSPPFTDIIHKKWNRVEVSAYENRLIQTLDVYPYYCIRSIDFQQKILNVIREHPSFHLLNGSVSSFSSDENKATLHTSDDSFNADYIFQSCFNPWQGTTDHVHYPLMQHFLGWEVTVSKPLFDEDTFTLMDFDETFTDGVAFIYFLPWSKETGLIEYTIFSDQLASKDLYEEKMAIYLSNRFGLKPIDYQIERREYGKIPMQDRPHNPWYQPRVLNLGTFGGLTKPSTGYTFRRIQEHAEAIVDGLISDGKPDVGSPSQKRFKVYDLWLLQIIHDHPKDALEVFNHLFQNNSMDEVFRFLGEESSFGQDLKIMNSVPYWPFLRAIWKSRNRLREI